MDESPPTCSDEMEQEIKCVTTLLKQAGTDTIPAFNLRKKRKPYINDANLKMKCNTSKSTSAWRQWKASGGSRSGAAFDAMRQAKKDVKEYVKLCRAREERKKIQKQDQLFKNRDPARFHIPRQKATCRKLVVDGNSHL